MMSFINEWTQGIVVAVIISGIIEMILPKGNMRKYINVIIGIYVLFVIISPIANKVLNKNVSEILDIDKFTKQIKSSEAEISKTIEVNNSKTIKDIYVSNLENNIKKNIESKGYEVKRLYIKVKDDENYTIENIEITVNENEQQETNRQSKIQVDDIIISKQNNDEDNGLKISSIIEIQNYLAETYQLDKNIIKVN